MAPLPGHFYINMLEIDVSSELPLLRLGAGRGEILSTVLRARVGKGARLFLFGKDQAVLFTPGVQTGALMQDDVFTVTMNFTGCGGALPGGFRSCRRLSA